MPTDGKSRKSDVVKAVSNNDARHNHAPRPPAIRSALMTNAAVIPSARTTTRKAHGVFGPSLRELRGKDFTDCCRSPRKG